MDFEKSFFKADNDAYGAVSGEDTLQLLGKRKSSERFLEC